MSKSIHEYLDVGNRVFLRGNGAATITGKDYYWPEVRHDGYLLPSSWYNEPEYTYKFQYDKAGTQEVTYKGDSKSEELFNGLTFVKDSGYKIGEVFEVEREGLDPNLRGQLLEIDEKAEMWPYRIGQEGGISIWFGFREIRKIHSVISAERSPRAKEIIKAQIELKKAELEALETALEVLEYAT